MEYLVWMDIACNNLSGHIPAALGNLTLLHTLFLSGNKLTGTVPQELGGCSFLEHLFLDSNDLTDGIPKSWSNLTNLVNLDLSDNNLRDKFGDVILLSTQCPLLETLQMGRNKLYGSQHLDFTKFTSLRYFSVADNMLTGGVPSSFGSINSSLVLVNFSQNRFTGGLPAQINSTNLDSLRSLNFSPINWKEQHLHG